MTYGLILRLRLIEEIEEWSTWAELVGGEHAGASVLLVPADRILPRAARGAAREPWHIRRRVVDYQFEPPRQRPPVLPDAGYSKSIGSKRKAMRLLESLLDERQLSSWHERRLFWVHTDYGDVELGRFGRLAFRRRDGVQFTLCVVPTRYKDLPDGDIWINLLLTLKGSPEHFFEVANYSADNNTWRHGPVPFAIPADLWVPKTSSAGLTQPVRTRG